VEFKVFRDSGEGLGIDDITTEVHADQLQDKSYLTTLEVTDFPPNAEGKRFNFIVKACTKHAVDGVASEMSASFILAGVPDKPAAGPVRGD
jgi:hypothetical protein